MKKLLAVMLSVITITTLMGCGNKVKKAEEVPITENSSQVSATEPTNKIEPETVDSSTKVIIKTENSVNSADAEAAMNEIDQELDNLLKALEDMDELEDVDLN